MHRTHFLLPLCLFCLPHFIAAQENQPAARHNPRSVQYVSRPMKASAATPALHAAATSATIPFWQGTSGTFAYEMVGANPASSGVATTIPTNVIPVILTFSDGAAFDPTVVSSCSAQSPQSLMMSSPLFNNSTYTVGGTTVGNTQFLDFFQRANFWQFTGAGSNPNYHVLLSAASAPPLNIAVPAASGSTSAAACGRLGQMDINWFDNYLASKVFPQLASSAVQPTSFPIFLLENVVMYDTTVKNCCILGYHSAFNNASFSNAIQTYAVTDFDTSGDFGITKDVSSASHEIAEWLDDPTGNNPTPSWGNIGQVTGCQSDLEVGDPLSGTDFTVTMSNSYTYHLQELAFKSWFYRDAPSTGVNGWYSSRGTFTAPSRPCNTTVTALSLNPQSLSPGSAATVDISVKHGTGSTGTPTGNVALVTSLSTTPVATYTLSAGAVSASTTALPAGNYNVTANYAGDANFSPSVSAPIAIRVGAAAVTLNPVALSFASRVVGTAGAALTSTLSNQGTAPLTVASISITGAAPADFSQTNNCGSSLAAAASCVISVTFKPTASGSRSASIGVVSGGSASPVAVLPVSGTATAGTTAPVVTLSATSLTFPSTALATATPAQTVTISNTGNATLTGLAITLAGANPGDFPGTTTCAATLASTKSCTVSITFKPSATGARTASINIADNATGAPQVVTLTGTGAGTAGAPVATVSVTALAFATTTVGNNSASQTLTVTNTGTAPLTFTSVSLSGANAGDFSGNTGCSGSLAVKAACSVTLTFNPKAAGARTAVLQFADNAAGSPQSVTLTGSGVAAKGKASTDRNR